MYNNQQNICYSGYGMSYCVSGYIRCSDGSCKLNKPLELCPGETCEPEMGYYYRRCNDGKRYDVLKMMWVE